MTTDEEKSRLSKLLENLEVFESKLPERCNDLVREFHKRFGSIVEKEESEMNETEVEVEGGYENPYKVDKTVMEEIERKLKLLLRQNQRIKNDTPQDLISNVADSKRPWRVNSNKEKLMRINGQIKRYHEKSADAISPLPDSDMKLLVEKCIEDIDSTVPVSVEKLRESINLAKKNLPNFKYKKIDNSTATSILPDAHPNQNDAVATTDYDDNIDEHCGDNDIQAHE